MSLLCPSMAFWSPRGARNNIFVCAQLTTTQVHGSPYTTGRSEFSNNHHLYRDIVPLSVSPWEVMHFSPTCYVMGVCTNLTIFT